MTMGSVKDLITDQTTPAGKLYIPAQPHRFGQGAWKVSGRFSVGDLKNLIPPIEIAGKGAVLAMMTGAYFEHAEHQGIPSCYLGMMDAEGRIVSTDTLLTRGETSDVVVMNLANTPQGHSAEALRAYHAAIANGDISVYVADAESIFRAGVPLGSSVFKKIFGLMGRGEAYEQIATYDETLAELTLMRTRVLREGPGHFRELEQYLASIGLAHIPNPGQRLPKPVLNFTTKFSPSGDEDITEEQARTRMGLSESRYADWKALAFRCAQDQIAYSSARQIVNIDGKVEAVVTGTTPILTDFANTPDENRLMLTFEKKGITYLLPTNKEMQRAMFRAEGVYAAIDAAKEDSTRAHGTADRWQEYLFNRIARKRLDDVARASCAMMGDALRTVANRALGKTVFEAKSIEHWVGPFLPYASRVQSR